MSTTVRRMSHLLLYLFLLKKIIGEDAKNISQPKNLRSAGKVNDPVGESGSTEQEPGPFRCKKYSDCNADPKPCHCDSMCNMYKDCCMNAPSRNETTTSIPDVLQYMTCKEWNKVDHIWVVTECPVESSESCASEGNEFGNFFVTDENNITYDNYRCALCHGVDKYSYWTFVLVHDIGSNSACNTSTNLVCEDADNFPENCINTLLAKGCDVMLFPQKDKYPRRCIESEELTNNMSCKTDYLPGSFRRKMYRNADCCAKLEGECSDDRYSCLTGGPTDFDFSLRSVSSIPTYTVFSFDKKCNDVSDCGEVLYFGIAFELDLRFRYETAKPDRFDIPSVICLLKGYFEKIEDSLSIQFVKSRMWKASDAHSFSLVVLDLRLKSNLGLRNNKDIQNLKDHLGKMLFSIYVNDNDKDNKFVMENSEGEANGYNISNLAMEEEVIKSHLINAWFRALDNDVCKAVQDVWDIPPKRCNHLNISVSSDALQLNTVYRCLGFATPNAPEGVTSGSTGAAAISTLGRYVSCFLLSVMSLALIPGIN